MTAPSSLPDGLSHDELNTLEDILDALREHVPDVPQWEFCDGFLTALACTRRPVAPEEFLPALLGNDENEDGTADVPAALTDAPFVDAAQRASFMELWNKRFAQVVAQLDLQVKALDDEDTFQPEVIDTRGAVASLSEAERAEMDADMIPAFAQVWALGFTYAVECFSEDWEPPRDKETAGWIEDSLEVIGELSEDDTGVPTVCMYSEDGPPSTSQARVETFGETIWAVYDLRQIWKSQGPRVETIVKGEQPGRNDPCSCGSGKKFKKCCGA